MLEENNTEVMHDELSVKSFLQVMEALLASYPSRWPWKSWKGHQKGNPTSAECCPTHTDQWNSRNPLFCVSLNCKSTTLKDCILKLHKGAIFQCAKRHEELSL